MAAARPRKAGGARKAAGTRQPASPAPAASGDAAPTVKAGRTGVHTLTPGKSKRLRNAGRCPSGNVAGLCPTCQSDGTCAGLRFAEG